MDCCEKMAVLLFISLKKQRGDVLFTVDLITKIHSQDNSRTADPAETTI